MKNNPSYKDVVALAQGKQFDPKQAATQVKNLRESNDPAEKKILQKIQNNAEATIKNCAAKYKAGVDITKDKKCSRFCQNSASKTPFSKTGIFPLCGIAAKPCAAPWKLNEISVFDIVDQRDVNREALFWQGV